MGAIDVLSIATIILACLLLLAILAMLIFRNGLYAHIPASARPRRWLVIPVTTVFVLFVVWFPIWLRWPRSPVSIVLTVIFGATFGVVFAILSNFAEVFEWIWSRMGWR